MKYSTLLIDADNTLFNFDIAQDAALKSTFKAFNLPYHTAIHQAYAAISRRLWHDLEEGRITLGELVRRRFHTLFAEFDLRADSTAFNERFLENLGTFAALFDGVDQTLAYLHASYRLYVVTNGVGPSQRARFDTLNIAHFFDAIFISEEIGVPKPHKGFFDYVFAHIAEQDKSKILIIGDSLSSDIAGGKNAGIATCWLNRQGARADIEPDYEIAHFTELKAFL